MKYIIIQRERYNLQMSCLDQAAVQVLVWKFLCF